MFPMLLPKANATITQHAVPTAVMMASVRSRGRPALRGHQLSIPSVKHLKRALRRRLDGNALQNGSGHISSTFFLNPASALVQNWSKYSRRDSNPSGLSW